MSILLERCCKAESRWAHARAHLWPDLTPAQHQRELGVLLRQQALVGFFAIEGSRLVAFAEASLRRDFVNGCDTRPVAFLEGIWVDEDFRRRGIAHTLVSAVEEWGREEGCTELGSDALLANEASHQAHHAWGFEEMERVVCFRKRLR